MTNRINKCVYIIADMIFQVSVLHTENSNGETKSKMTYVLPKRRRPHCECEVPKVLTYEKAN